MSRLSTPVSGILMLAWNRRTASAKEVSLTSVSPSKPRLRKRTRTPSSIAWSSWGGGFASVETARGSAIASGEIFSGCLTNGSSLLLTAGVAQSPGKPLGAASAPEGPASPHQACARSGLHSCPPFGLRSCGTGWLPAAGSAWSVETGTGNASASARWIEVKAFPVREEVATLVCYLPAPNTAGGPLVVASRTRNPPVEASGVMLVEKKVLIVPSFCSFPLLVETTELSAIELSLPVIE